MKMPGKMLPKIFGFIFKKPVTVLYPKERLTPPKGLRGKMKFHLERCIHCGLCSHDCPSGACTMQLITGDKKQPVFDLDFCTFCAQCEEVCPKDAIEMTTEFELAHYKRGEAIVK
ncbi:MAG: 4Fe-4S dicluster domain-containing protein [Euryarchaeota archaeon]|nr:4Fe-4S dicluster domain-containing protein [Euryarchaeota archaeon]